MKRKTLIILLCTFFFLVTLVGVAFLINAYWSNKEKPLDFDHVQTTHEPKTYFVDLPGGTDAMSGWTITNALVAFEKSYGAELQAFQSPAEIAPDDLVLLALTYNKTADDIASYLNAGNPNSYYVIPMDFMMNELNIIFGSVIKEETLQKSSFFQTDGKSFRLEVSQVQFLERLINFACVNNYEGKHFIQSKATWYYNLTGQEYRFVNYCTRGYEWKVNGDKYELIRMVEFTKYE